MKAIKTLLAVSALATIASAANATVWDISLSTNTFFAAAGGPLVINLSGTYDDAATVDNAVYGGPITGVAIVGGDVAIPGFATSMHYQTLEFDMGADGYGASVLGDANPPNCTGNTVGGCPGFTGALVFSFYNAINFAQTTSKAGTFDNSTANPFTLVNGTNNLTWTAVANVPNSAGKNTLSLLPFDVTISTQAPAVPVPAAAWLFGSGLLGLAGTARRRNKA